MARWHSDTTDLAVIILPTHHKMFSDWIIIGIFYTQWNMYMYYSLNKTFFIHSNINKVRCIIDGKVWPHVPVYLVLYYNCDCMSVFNTLTYNVYIHIQATYQSSWLHHCCHWPGEPPSPWGRGRGVACLSGTSHIWLYSQISRNTASLSIALKVTKKSSFRLLLVERWGKSWF